MAAADGGPVGIGVMFGTKFSPEGMSSCEDFNGF